MTAEAEAVFAFYKCPFCGSEESQLIPLGETPGPLTCQPCWKARYMREMNLTSIGEKSDATPS